MTAFQTERSSEWSIGEDGCQLLRGVLTRDQCVQAAADIDAVLLRQRGDAITAANRSVVGGRNLQMHWHQWRRWTLSDLLRPALHRTLGDAFGLVRILFFDKPPGKSWNMAVHRDRAIAVKGHHDPPMPYSKPTIKAGVPHVVADDALLERMLVVRVQLDAMHAGNGPLTIVPGSHSDRRSSAHHGDAIPLHCDAGDAFLMRPLLLHGSLATEGDCHDHRRVIHLEFAPRDALAAPYRWYRYDAVL